MVDPVPKPKMLLLAYSGKRAVWASAADTACEEWRNLKANSEGWDKEPNEKRDCCSSG